MLIPAPFFDQFLEASLFLFTWSHVAAKYFCQNYNLPINEIYFCFLTLSPTLPLSLLHLRCLHSAWENIFEYDWGNARVTVPFTFQSVLLITLAWNIQVLAFKWCIFCLSSLLYNSKVLLPINASKYSLQTCKIHNF